MIELDTLKAKLYDRTPLLGGGRRKAAAEAIAALDDGLAALPLAETLISLEDDAVHRVALERLARVVEPPAIDQVCALWAVSRHPRLAAVIAEHQWVAREPYAVQVLGRLVAGGAGAMVEAVPELVPALVYTTEDLDPVIAEAAWQALAGLARQDAREALCDMVLDGDDMRAIKAVREGGHLPEDPRRRALLLLLTDQGDQYEKADPDGQLLAEALRVASPERRKRMAEKAKEARLGPWARAILARPITGLQTAEWEALLLVLAELRDFASLWRLVPIAPVTTSVGYMRYLRMVGWVPPADAPDAGLYHKLAGLVPRCVGDPSGMARRLRERTMYDGRPGTATVIALSPDWRYLAIGGDDTAVRIISLPDGSLATTLTELPGWTRALAFGNSGRYLAIATMKHQTRVHRLPDGLPVAYLDTRDVAALALRGDGQLLAAASGGRVDLWDVEGGRVTRSLAAHGRLVKGLVIGGRGRTLASWGADGATRIWTLPEGRMLTDLPGPEAGVATVALSADEARLAIAGADHVVRVFSLPGGELLTELPGDGNAVRTLAFRPDGDLLAIGGHDHRVRLFSIPNGDPQGLAEGYAGAGALAWNGMDQLLAAATEGKQRAKIWFPAAPPLTAETVRDARPEEIAWAQRLHRDPDLKKDDRAWLTYWGTLVLAARGSLPTAGGGGDRPVGEPGEDPHPWEAPPDGLGAA